jgi:hypothetical protein
VDAIAIPFRKPKGAIWVLTEDRAQTIDAVEKLVAARVASLSTRRVERFENSCIGSVRVIPL